MEPILLVIRSSGASSYSLQKDGSAVLSFVLAKNYEIPTPHVAKLLHVHGPRKPIFCAFDFVKPQDVCGGEAVILGSSIESTNTYVPIASTYINAVGWVTLTNVDGTPMTRLPNITLWLHIVPKATLALWRSEPH